MCVITSFPAGVAVLLVDCYGEVRYIDVTRVFYVDLHMTHRSMTYVSAKRAPTPNINDNNNTNGTGNNATDTTVGLPQQAQNKLVKPYTCFQSQGHF